MDHRGVHNDVVPGPEPLIPPLSCIRGTSVYAHRPVPRAQDRTRRRTERSERKANRMTSPSAVPMNPVNPVAKPDDLRPWRTRVDDICVRLTDLLSGYTNSSSWSIDNCPQRDAQLARFRAAVTAQILHDLDYNTARLLAFARILSARAGCDVARLPVPADGFRRLEELSAFMHHSEPYGRSSLEEERWIALHQYYFDALDLAERLCDLADGKEHARGIKLEAQGTIRRHGFFGVTGYSLAQSLVQALSVAVPDIFNARWSRTLLPSLAFIGSHHLWPPKRLDWMRFERTTLGWLSRDGFAQLGNQDRCVVEFKGRDRLIADLELFDPSDRTTRHNIIVAASHRTGFLDYPFWTVMLRDIRHGLWVNNSFYGPAIERKTHQEPLMIPARGSGKSSIKRLLDNTLHVLSDLKAPVLIVADGSQPSLLYGDQVRVKRGLRLVVDESVRRRQATGRRTFVIPLTFNDPVSYLRGLSDRIVVECHPPIEIDRPSCDKAYESHFVSGQINGGDDLLNHLEALFLLNTMQPQFGMGTPDVLSAVRDRRRRRRSVGARAWLRSKFNTSICDLSRSAIAPRAHI